jgi:flavin-binding protein dodecin
MTVAKVIEISASSSEGFEAAIREGLAKARETVHGISGAWIKEQKVDVGADGSVTQYRVFMDVTFVLD